MTIEKAREILGEKVKSLSDDEVEEIVTNIKKLARFCLDTYEQNIYGRKLRDFEFE